MGAGHQGATKLGLLAGQSPPTGLLEGSHSLWPWATKLSARRPCGVLERDSPPTGGTRGFVSVGA